MALSRFYYPKKSSTPICHYPLLPPLPILVTKQPLVFLPQGTCLWASPVDGVLCILVTDVLICDGFAGAVDGLALGPNLGPCRPPSASGPATRGSQVPASDGSQGVDLWRMSSPRAGFLLRGVPG